MGISFGSINTGLPPNIVQQLVDAERVPIKAVEARKGKSQEQLKLVQDITGKVRDIFAGLRELGSNYGFSDVKIQTGDPDVIAGTADKNIARPGSYQVEVIKLAKKTSAVSNSFPDKDESQVGAGYFRYKDAEGKSRDFFVDKKDSTLENLAKMINAKAVGIQASVIQDRSDKENPYRLMMTGKGVGEDKAVEFPTFYFLDGDQDFFVDKERGAENGRIKVDGYEFDINDNKLSDVIPGVTLDLRSAMPGREINISVSEDKEVITGKIKKFVDQMNGVFQFIQAQNKLDKDSDTSKTLGGDALLRDIENRFRNILQGQVFGVQGSVKYLSEVGISFNRSGMLNFDEEKFNAIVSKNLPAVTEFFIGDGMAVGMVPQLKNALNQMLDPTSGPLLQRERGLKSKINQFDDQIANKERILAQKEVQLKNQFARLEETMSRLKAQGSYLQARMGGGGDMGFNLKGG